MSSRNDPFETIQRMFEQMSRQFEEAARSWQSSDGGMGQPAPGTMGIDLADRGDEFVVTADLPGFESEDVNLRIADSTLSIDATRERSTETDDETYLRSERHHRSMTERVRLPEPVDEEGVEATLRNGVLTVHVPKAEPTDSGGRSIDIE